MKLHQGSLHTGSNDSGIHHWINVASTNNAADPLASKALGMSQKCTYGEATRWLDFEVDVTETVVYCLYSVAIGYFEDICYTMLKYLPIEFAQTQGACTVRNCRWFLFVTDQLTTMERASRIIARNWLSSNNLCSGMYMVAGNYDTRTESASANWHDYDIKVACAKDFFAERRIPGYNAVIIIGLSLECIGLLCQKLSYPLGSANLAHINEVNYAAIGSYSINFHLGRGHGHHNGAGFTKELAGISDGLSKIAGRGGNDTLLRNARKQIIGSAKLKAASMLKCFARQC
jgi:hypothetical protein